MGSDHQEGRRLCRLIASYSCARRKGRGIHPGPFFFCRVVVEGALTGTKPVIDQGRAMIRSTKDFWTGVLYVFFGLTAIIVARDYGMGTAVRMGPAYFPTILG